MAVDRHLVFRVVRTQDRHLVLGKSESLETIRQVTIAGVFDPLALSILADYTPPIVEYDFTLAYTFPDLVLAIDVNYEFDTPNYLVALLGAPWRQAERVNDQKTELPWQQAARTDTGFSLPWHQGLPVGALIDLPWHQAAKVNPGGVSLPWHSAQPVNPHPIDLPWQQAQPLDRLIVLPWKSGKATHRPFLLPWQQGRRHHRAIHLPWRDGGRMVSYGGPSIVPDIPPEPPDPCYIPTRHLVISEPHGNRHLVLVCELHPLGPTIVVPIRKVYVVINSAVLIRVSDSLPIPVYGMSMSIDVDSFTYSFSATAQGSQYANLAPDVDGTPVEVQATVNGIAYRFLVEHLATDRTFGRIDMQIGGRGKNAILDAPYAPILTFENSAGDLTAAQLMDQALMLNAVPIGWDVDFNLDDWLVTAGAWSHQGTHISAVMAIAAAAGGYVQPHRTDDTLIVLPRYPFLPRDWLTDVTPDFVLPDAVVVQEAIEWAEKTRYNRVFVSGQAQGRLVQVTITGTAGDIVPPTIVDALITHVDAGRQRGQSVLGDTGRVAMVTLRLPMLPATAWIHPGKFVSYAIDGGPTRVGLVRASSLQVDMPRVWQTITVETHE